MEQKRISFVSKMSQYEPTMTQIAQSLLEAEVAAVEQFAAVEVVGRIRRDS